MQSPPQISWRNLTKSPAVEELIERRIAGLDRFNPNIVGCNVMIEAPQTRHVTACGFQVRVDLPVQGPDTSVARSVPQGHAADDLHLAVNTAFGAVERNLKEHNRQLAGQEVRHHPLVFYGEPVDLEHELGFRDLRANDASEVGFQRDGLINGDWALGLGDRFREMDG